MASKDEAISFGDTVDLIKRAFKAHSNPAALSPHYDADSGRYDNLGGWLDLRKDALVYGVRVPKFGYSPVSTAVKTGANAGLVLEASTATSAGRNDYAGRALFECIRVNGGVDADGMPYVTAIEGYDDRFTTAQDTYALTPVYYRRTVEDSNYLTYEYTDSPKTGFAPCFGAYTAKGELRPYILRACFMDSGDDFSSKAGTQPAAYRGSPVAASHSGQHDLTASKGRSDGLTYLTYGDLAYQMDFMQLMLGVKAPRQVAVGCVSYNFQYTVAAAEYGAKRVILTDAQAANILVGSSLSVGTHTGGSSDRQNVDLHDIAACAKVLSKTSLGDGNTAINLDLAEPIDVLATYFASTMPWRNGTCEGVLGTFGTPTAAGLTDGKWPYRFQNVEYNLGIYEALCDMHSKVQVDDAVERHEWYVAPDVAEVSAFNEASGWEKLACETVAVTPNAWNFIGEQAVEKGARVPSDVSATSSTGYRVAWHPGTAADGAERETLAGGTLGSGASLALWPIGGRSSAIGHSAPAE